ncbi:uncharacterized protein HMPREF1541_08278 [Cyphellophora europaea CBS 101466]|uniref:Uncharacterized protein n=1 Tax=Cyphellophora europaea (strain CBS 101466) TaxID=1220924 RepID=W2RLD0_CYPE1|nr:uncharacterized protein HMPREF1541_08278 [Cyphellophora europaea CBS 101466]ETN37287.1 hypothetical protein HMPREF1541_08278 [Cyphellophora europaea CBS 101466]
MTVPHRIDTGSDYSLVQWNPDAPDTADATRRGQPIKRRLLVRDSQYEILPRPSSNDAVSSPGDGRTRPQPRHKGSWGWSWELLSVAMVIGCFGGIIGLLISLDGGPVPDWGAGFTVNAVLSIIVTVMKGAIGIVIAECLSQLKWSWFKRSRRLIDLVIWDEASRGAWGARRLLMTARTWYLGYIGALTVLAAFIIGPSIQQTVEVVVRQVELPSNATMPVCNSSYYQNVGLGGGAGLNKVDLTMLGSIYNGFVQTTTLSGLRPNCPSGNCTFGMYQSLGLCTECFDRSDELIFLNTTSNETIAGEECTKSYSCAKLWPGGGRALSAYGTINSTVDDVFNLTDDSSVTSVDRMTDPIVYEWKAVTDPRDTKVYRPPRATQCKVRFCVKTYESSIEAGEFRERLINSTWAKSLIVGDSLDLASNITIPVDPCYVDGAPITPPPGDNIAGDNPCVYRLPDMSSLAFANSFDSFVIGSGSSIASNRHSFENDVIQAMYGLFKSEDLMSEELGSFASVDRAWASMATVVTDYARSAPDTCGGATALGIQLQDELYLKVHWVWLTPTAVVFAVSVAFFVATVIHSWGEDLWKSSPLAFLAATAWSDGRKMAVQDIWKDEETQADKAALERSAKRLEVRLEPGNRYG